MTRKTNTRNVVGVTPFVVFVTFPSSSKEYAYLCSDPAVMQGSIVIANGTHVTVIRTAPYDPANPRATRFVQSDTEATKNQRRSEIFNRLRLIEARERDIARFSSLKSPEAKKLVAELKRLG